MIQSSAVNVSDVSPFYVFETHKSLIYSAISAYEKFVEWMAPKVSAEDCIQEKTKSFYWLQNKRYLTADTVVQCSALFLSLHSKRLIDAPTPALLLLLSLDFVFDAHLIPLRPSRHLRSFNMIFGTVIAKTTQELQKWQRIGIWREGID